MSPLFRRKPDALFYRQAMEFVHELKNELSTSGIHFLELPTKKKPLFSLQFADASPPLKPDDHRRIQVVSLRKKLAGPMLRFFNEELLKSATAGMIAWDDDLYRKHHIGMREDEDGFTGLSLPVTGGAHNLLHRGNIATALNELEVAINGHIDLLKRESGKASL